MKKTKILVDGAYFDTIVFDDVKSTNEFLEKNKNYGVIKEDKQTGKVYVAKMTDRGTLVKMLNRKVSLKDIFTK